MFVLANLEDTIKIEAHDFRKEPAAAIADAINTKYSNRVLQDVGLCIALHDLLTCSVGKVRWGDGCLFYQCTFRMVVFRPFVGEVVTGTIKLSTEEGIDVSMGFFDDIFLPSELLPSPRAFDHEEKAWFWIGAYEPDDPCAQDPLSVPKEDRFYMDPGEIVRFRVEGDQFYDAEPGPPVIKEANGDAEEEKPAGVLGTKRAPYTIIGSCTSSGLGLPAWWVNAEASVE